MMIDLRDYCAVEDSASTCKLPLVHSECVSDATTTDDDDSQIPSFREISPMKGGDMVVRFLSLLTASPNLGENANTVRMIHKVLRMMRTCKYDQKDVISVLALTAINHNRLVAALNRTTVSSTELTFILLAEIYIAHSVVLDECCSLANWHKYLFSCYCDLKSLNSAISRILKKLDWSVNVSDLSKLHAAIAAIDSSDISTYH